jgi:Type VI secretion system (T6SS), amidase effector protein 4
MAIALDFETVWAKYQAARPVAAGITEGNRCAMVLAMALGKPYYPNSSKGEASFADLKDSIAVNAKGTARNLLAGKLKVADRMTDGIEGQPFLQKYYVKAEQFAKRLRNEWGDPDFVLKGSPKNLVKTTMGKRGVIYMENAWTSGEDHVDLWSGSTTAAYVNDAAYINKHIEESSEVWLWTMTSMTRFFDGASSKSTVA